MTTDEYWDKIEKQLEGLVEEIEEKGYCYLSTEDIRKIVERAFDIGWDAYANDVYAWRDC